MQGFWLGYLFVAFGIGVACLGVAIGLAVRRRDAVSRAFLACYGAFSVMVTASLVLAFADTAPGVISDSGRRFFQYLESIVGLYGVMLTLPLLAHRVFRVDDAARERVVILAVLATLGLQHVTEFALGATVWDQRGDWLEDGVLVLIVAYTFWVMASRFGSAAAEQPLARRMFVLLVLGLPGVGFDLLFGEAAGVFLYPLWYGATSVVVTWTMFREERRSGPEPARPRAAVGWGLSAREIEVAEGVARGLSNKEVAAALHISPNTVKTHLRAVFEKTGVRSRFELMARMSEVPRANHPEG